MPSELTKDDLLFLAKAAWKYPPHFGNYYGCDSDDSLIGSLSYYLANPEHG
jgi:hypothetical protein